MKTLDNIKAGDKATVIDYRGRPQYVLFVTRVTEARIFTGMISWSRYSGGRTWLSIGSHIRPTTQWHVDYMAKLHLCHRVRRLAMGDAIDQMTREQLERIVAIFNEGQSGGDVGGKNEKIFRTPR